MTAAESADLVERGRRERPGQRGQLQHPLLPAPPARPRGGRRRRARRRPPRHRPLLPGLAAPRHRLELAPRARQGRRAPGGRRHRLALARPDGLRHRPADRLGDGRPGDVHHDPAASRPVRSRRSRPSAPRETVDAADGHRGRRRRSSSASPTVPAARWPCRRSAPAGRTRSSGRSTAPTARGGLGLRDARPPLARPPRPAERAPPPQPGADGRRPGGPRPPCPAATSRASATRSARCSARSTPTSPPAVPNADPPYADVRRRPRRDARQRRDRRAAPASGRWVDVDRSRDRVAGRSLRPAAGRFRASDEAGSADRRVPGHRRSTRSSAGRRPNGSRRSRSPAGRRSPATTAATPGVTHIDVDALDAAGAAAIRGELDDRGLEISSASPTTRTTSIPDPAIRRGGQRPPPEGDRRGRDAGRGARQHVHRPRPGPIGRPTTWPRSRKVWPELVRFAGQHGVHDRHRELPDDLLGTTSGPAARTSPTRPAIWRRMFEIVDAGRTSGSTSTRRTWSGR